MRKVITKQTFVRYLHGFLIIASLQVVSSCINDEYPSEDGQQATTTVKFNLSNRGGVPGTDSEIKTLRVIAFDSRTGVKQYNGVVGNSPETIEILSGVRDFYFIANEPASKTTALSAVKTLDALESIQIPSGELHSGTTFVAYGSLLGATITPKVTNTVTVDDLKRLAVKIKLSLRGKNFTTPKEVNLKNLPDAVPLMETAYVASASQQVGVPMVSFGTTTPLPSGYIWAIHNNEIIVPSSLFAPVTDENKAAVIEVKLSDTKTVKGKLCRTSVADGSKDYTLPRNVEYTLVCNVGADKLDVEASIANWNSKDQDYPAGGGSFWNAQPQSVRVGLDATDSERTAIFTAKISSNASVSYEWYRKRQHSDMSYTTELLVNDVANGITLSQGADHTSTLTIVASKLDNSGEIYCKGITTSPDGKQESLESAHATLMVVGTQTSSAGEYPDMQNWVTPRNALLGATCLLRDSRDGKVYRTKLMADGHWWMIQDLAYGNSMDKSVFDANCSKQDMINLIAADTYGVCTKATPEIYGGYLYNPYAALQFKGQDSDVGGPDLQKEFIPGLCPNGWHLPGNANGEYNNEWSVFIDKTLIDLNSNSDISLFEYNHSRNFNSYNIEPDFVKAPTYHGGYRAGKSGRTDPVDFLTLGIVATTDFGGVLTQLDERNPNRMRISIRCVRNYVK